MYVCMHVCMYVCMIKVYVVSANVELMFTLLHKFCAVLQHNNYTAHSDYNFHTGLSCW